MQHPDQDCCACFQPHLKLVHGFGGAPPAAYLLGPVHEGPEPQAAQPEHLLHLSVASQASTPSEAPGPEWAQATQGCRCGWSCTR